VSTTPPTTLAVGDRAELRRRAADVGLRGAARRRACIVLLAAAGLSTTEIAARLGVSRPTAAAWRTRYERAGLAGLCDVARPGRPRRVDREQIIRATLDPVPVHHDTSALRSIYGQAVEHDSTGWFSGVACPSLVVGGAEDILFPRVLTERLASQLPGSRLELLPAAHLPPVEVPRPFNDLVLATFPSSR